ncbi:hypothetical protein PPSIR1_11315 [Plesiocystis pacifica SIR-1]|uniref:Uncharacterized protein n=1 Tax=Plesiocystis pacifica SIR-1 TaxID=391625 RepID=A6G166_9BACT|nr:hypothetical protein [Plesiocystis pacifica]EDM80361.1 hypothetical protein PPSIR1_11315 [Plesiocystis pacifica SIR-1]
MRARSQPLGDAAPSIFGRGLSLFSLGLLGALSLAASSCGEGVPGIDPPSDSFLFPSGVLLDPRVSAAAGEACLEDADCPGADEVCGGGGFCREPARWLFVTNANSDRRYNAGWMMAVDLDAYWEAAFANPDGLLDAGDRPSASQPCRRIAGRPQSVECLEAPFVATGSTVHFGDFAGPAVGWDPDTEDDEAKILIPVRGDPSITFLDLSGGQGSSGAPTLECDQAGDVDGGRYCGDFHRLRFLRNDPEANRISREPFRVLVSSDPTTPLAYITHNLDTDLTIMNLEGLLVGGDGRPAIVHQANIFQSSSLPGGFGLAERACDAEAGNAPTSTLECTRPMIYSSLRYEQSIQVVTAVEREPLDAGGYSQTCVGPDELDIPGGIICDYRVENLGRFGVQGLLQTGSPVLADIAFTDEGEELYAIQSVPGALLRIDTSLDVDGDPLNVTVGQVEVCGQPTSLRLYEDGESKYGLITCYRSAELFIVDLSSLAVAAVVRLGIGPDQLELDYAREVVYAANTLDATVSVVDMSRTSPSRFTEIGRIGLSEPYTQ